MNTLTIEDMKKALLVCTLINVLYSKDDKLTYLMLGPTASGKSSVVKELCDYNKWDYDIIDCNTLGEKEIAGWPYKSNDKYGSPCLSFYPYETFAKIMDKEKYYVETLGEEYLKPNKKELLLEGKVRIHYIFIDEINRANRSVMQELMNIVLKRKVRDYVLPWWVEIVAAGNSVSLNSAYSVTRLDKAQLRRFVIAKSEINKQRWLDFMSSNYENNEKTNEYLNYIKNCDMKYFAEVGDEDAEQTEQIPTQYGHTQCCNIYSKSDELFEMFRDSYFKGWSSELYFNILKSIYIGLIGEKAVENNRYISVFNYKEIVRKVMELDANYLSNLSASESVLVKEIICENFEVLKDTQIFELLPRHLSMAIITTLSHDRT